MVAGSNLKVTIWRMTPQTDDYAGGVQFSGTVLYQDLLARMQGQPTEEILLQQQGLETLRTFIMTLHPGNKDIRERDEVEITFPPTYPYLNDRFRILQVRYSDFNDERRYMILSLQRSERAHTEQ